MPFSKVLTAAFLNADKPLDASAEGFYLQLAPAVYLYLQVEKQENQDLLWYTLVDSARASMESGSLLCPQGLQVTAAETPAMLANLLPRIFSAYVVSVPNLTLSNFLLREEENRADHFLSYLSSSRGEAFRIYSQWVVIAQLNIFVEKAWEDEVKTKDDFLRKIDSFNTKSLQVKTLGLTYFDLFQVGVPTLAKILKIVSERSDLSLDFYKRNVSEIIDFLDACAAGSCSRITAIYSVLLGTVDGLKRSVGKQTAARLLPFYRSELTSSINLSPYNFDGSEYLGHDTHYAAMAMNTFPEIFVHDPDVHAPLTPADLNHPLRYFANLFYEEFQKDLSLTAVIEWILFQESLVDVNRKNFISKITLLEKNLNRYGHDIYTQPLNFDFFAELKEEDCPLLYTEVMPTTEELKNTKYAANDVYLLTKKPKPGLYLIHAGKALELNIKQKYRGDPLYCLTKQVNDLEPDLEKYRNKISKSYVFIREQNRLMLVCLPPESGAYFTLPVDQDKASLLLEKLAGKAINATVPLQQLNSMALVLNDFWDLITASDPTARQEEGMRNDTQFLQLLSSLQQEGPLNEDEAEEAWTFVEGDPDFPQQRYQYHYSKQATIDLRLGVHILNRLENRGYVNLAEVRALTREDGTVVYYPEDAVKLSFIENKTTVPPSRMPLLLYLQEQCQLGNNTVLDEVTSFKAEFRIKLVEEFASFFLIPNFSVRAGGESLALLDKLLSFFKVDDFHHILPIFYQQGFLSEYSLLKTFFKEYLKQVGLTSNVLSFMLEKISRHHTQMEGKTKRENFLDFLENALGRAWLRAVSDPVHFTDIETYLKLFPLVTVLRQYVEFNRPLDGLYQAALTQLRMTGSDELGSVLQLYDLMPSLRPGFLQNYLSADGYGYTAAHYAAIYGRVKTIKALIHYHQDYNTTTNNNETVLDLSLIYKQHEITFLILNDIRRREHDETYEPIYLANSYGHIDFLRFLFKRGEDFKKIFNGSQLVHLASEAQQVASLRFLILEQKIFSGTETDESGLQALHRAVLKKNEKAVLFLHKEVGISLDSLTRDGSSPLHLCAKYGFLEFIPIFKEAGAKFNIINQAGDSPLDLALRNEHYVFAGSLLEGLDEQDLTIEKVFLLATAEEIYEENLEYLTIIDQKFRLFLRTPEEALEFFLKSESDHYKNVLLNYPIFKNLANSQESLRAVMASFDFVDKENFDARELGVVKPVMDKKMQVYMENIIQEDFKNVLEFLAQGGLNLGQSDETGRQLIHYAVMYTAPNCLDFLVDKNINQIDAKTQFGETAYILAFQNNKNEMLSHLWKIHRLNPNELVDGNAVIHFAASVDDLYLINNLIAVKADLTLKNSMGKTGLDFAMEHSAWKAAAALFSAMTVDELKSIKPSVAAYLAYLLKNDISLQAHDSDKLNALVNNRDSFIEWLNLMPDDDLRNRLWQEYYFTYDLKEADFYPIIATFSLSKKHNVKPDDYSPSALVRFAFDAAAKDYVLLLDTLLKLGVSLESRDADNQHKTFLHYAIENSAEDVFLYLLKANVDLSSIDDQQRTALHYAAEVGFEDIFKILPAQKALLHHKNSLGESALAVAVKSQHWSFAEQLLRHHLPERLASDDLPLLIQLSFHLPSDDRMKTIIREQLPSHIKAQADFDSLLSILPGHYLDFFNREYSSAIDQKFLQAIQEESSSNRHSSSSSSSSHSDLSHHSFHSQGTVRSREETNKEDSEDPDPESKRARTKK